MNRTDVPTPNNTPRTLTVATLSALAVASLIAAGTTDTPPTEGPHQPLHVAGGVWGGV